MAELHTQTQGRKPVFRVVLGESRGEMKSLQEEFRMECRVCGGASYKFGADGIQRKCTACNGTGKSREYQELEKLVIHEPLTESDIAKIDEIAREYESVFTCQHCGATKVHYHLHGYKCPHRCEG